MLQKIFFFFFEENFQGSHTNCPAIRYIFLFFSKKEKKNKKDAAAIGSILDQYFSKNIIDTAIIFKKNVKNKKQQL